ncbi:Ger(x)C family spore germination protein [Bacillus sp. ISL-47]|uniref:Ger(x)C family spore germination protein n=1 Tax=Bacillus sp. ISL-47 TaxID=2819130 RepID=UPI001BED1E4F|nr:Ger(x)C family spore germination protein [Bacillus sp. ISL-47]MBT2686725.1 Ger(x)C family spore germination protein [Bacillus sp. ISL-47]MBT2706927.1 Ger(x)C family spore germination protein [Pseudomonas sp. ISL-84]
MRYLALLLLPFTMIILTGCWGSTELRDVGIVSGIGIDKGDESGFDVTAQTIKTGSPNSDLPSTAIVHTAHGATVFEAIRNFIIEAKRKEIHQHIDSLIIGKTAAEDGVTPAFDFFLRDHEPRFNMSVFLAEENAKEILEIVNTELFDIPARAMRNSLVEQKALSKAPYVELHNFYQRLIEPYQDPYMPIIHKRVNDFENYGTAIFKGDKLVGELDAVETRGMLRVQGELKGGIQVIHMPLSEEETVNVSIEIKDSKTSINTILKNGQPVIEILIQETGFIGETSKAVRLTNENIKKINQLYEKAVKKEVKNTVDKIQKELKANTFDFAEIIRRKENDYWKQHKEQWEEIYPSLKVVVKVSTDLPANGLLNYEGGR